MCSSDLFDWGNEKDFLYSQALNKVKGLPVVRSTVEATGRTAKATVPAVVPTK